MLVTDSRIDHGRCGRYAISGGGMRFLETEIPGAFSIEVEERTDDRGFFARTFCQHEFAARGLTTAVAQCNIAFNHTTGTVRGMHYQAVPAAEAKLIRCVRGAIWAVVLDVRPDSPAFCRWAAVELTAENHRALYLPELCAAGYQTLADNSEVFYQMSAFYAPACERGVRHDDPAFGIRWPLPVSAISAKDAGWPAFTPGQEAVRDDRR